MPSDFLTCGRRHTLKQLTLGAALFSIPGLFAELLAGTPSQTEGPFYPNKLPLDTDNDLLVINDRITPAVGEIAHVTGRILSATGAPIRNAEVEVWQADINGVYLHKTSWLGRQYDSNFQGFGRFVTGSSGEYYFRTIKPVPYPLRTPHIHFAINKRGTRMLTTQLYVEGIPYNDQDPVLNEIKDPQVRASLIVPFHRVEGSRLGEWQARFDITLGVTPEDPKQDPDRGISRKPDALEKRLEELGVTESRVNELVEQMARGGGPFPKE